MVWIEFQRVEECKYCNNFNKYCFSVLVNLWYNVEHVRRNEGDRVTILNLHMFVEIVKDMNLCVTAQRLNTTQQGLSGHIKRLETHFGVRLFERNPRLLLTSEGNFLQRESKSILDAEQRIFTHFGTGGKYHSGSIRVSCGMARARYSLPHIISEFTSLYPSVSVNLVDENTLRETDVFSEAKVDMVIGRPVKTSSQVMEIPLIDLQGFIMVSDSLLRKSLKSGTENFIRNAQGGVEVKDIPGDIPMAFPGVMKKEPWICEQIPELRSRPRVSVDRENYDILVGLCREGKMMMLISEMYLHFIKKTYSSQFYENIHFFPHIQEGCRFIEHEVLSYDASKYHPQYFQDFISIILKEFQGIRHEFDECR